MACEYAHISLTHRHTHKAVFFSKGTTELINYTMFILSLSSHTFHFPHIFLFALLL